MNSFYKIVIGVTLVIFVLVLILMGIFMRKNNNLMGFPTYAAPCPDGWNVVADGGCRIPANTFLNYPQYPTTMFGADLNGNGKLTVIDNTNILKFKDSTTICNKQSWANKVGVSWDGVTNYNKC